MGMQTAHSRAGEFRKVGENMYRYSSNGVYYARFKNKGKLIHRSLNTTDRTLANRRLKEEISKVNKVDPKLAIIPLSELLRLYDEKLSQYAPKTMATRRSILKIFKATWKLGLDVPVKNISAGQIEIWLAGRKADLKNATYNEYARFFRHVFDLAVKLRVLPESPAAKIKGLRVEAPIRTTPTWEQFQIIVANIRSQRFSDTAVDSANLVEFMGLAGVGTAECANLRGDHIDFQLNRINLYRQKTDTGYSVPIYPQLLPFLRRLEADGQIKPGQCHRSLQNQPVRVESKPATLRR
jgi:integrase